MKYINTFLVTLPLLSLFCVLEPYTVVDETGSCYQGFDKFQMLMKDNLPVIRRMSTLPDTMVVDSSIGELQIEYTCHLDTAFFRYGNYAMEIRGISLAVPPPDSSEAPVCQRSIGWYLFPYDPDLLHETDSSFDYRTQWFGDVKVQAGMKHAILRRTADTLTIRLALSINAREYCDSLYAADHCQRFDTAVVRAEFSFYRYVGEAFCCSYTLHAAVPIVLIVRRPDE